VTDANVSGPSYRNGSHANPVNQGQSTRPKLPAGKRALTPLREMKVLQPIGSAGTMDMTLGSGRPPHIIESAFGLAIRRGCSSLGIGLWDASWDRGFICDEGFLGRVVVGQEVHCGSGLYLVLPRSI
jgi:hypothetical protein